MTSTCPPDKPFANNDIYQIGDQVVEFRRCVSAEVCRAWAPSTTAANPKCGNFDPSKSGGDLTCHLCCYGNNAQGYGCNADTNPAPETLFKLNEQHPQGWPVQDYQK